MAELGFGYSNGSVDFNALVVSAAANLIAPISLPAATLPRDGNALVVLKNEMAPSPTPSVQFKHFSTEPLVPAARQSVKFIVPDPIKLKPPPWLMWFENPESISATELEVPIQIPLPDTFVVDPMPFVIVSNFTNAFLVLADCMLLWYIIQFLLAVTGW